MLNEIPKSINGRKNFVFFFAKTGDHHIGKDFCIIPNFFAESGLCNAYLVCENVGQKFPNKELLAPYLEIVFLQKQAAKRYSRYKQNLHQLVFLIRNSRRIDFFATCHFSSIAKISAIVYKLIHPRGRVWIKMDASKHAVEHQLQKLEGGSIVSIGKHLLNRFALQFVDVLSSEGYDSVECLKKTYPKQVSKIHQISNPINVPLLQALNYSSSFCDQKENLIITVARIGKDYKNNEMMLDSLSGLDLGSWKFVFIGPIEESFRQNIDDFFSANPHLKESVIFTGNIVDKHLLYGWYRRSKVFCLSSRVEGFCNAQLDAIYFGLFNVSTPVSGIEDISDNWRFGRIIYSSEDLRKVLIEIINGNFDPSEQLKDIIEHSKRFHLECVCERLKIALDWEG